MTDMDKAKHDRLLELIQQAVKNPSSAKSVATEIAKNWFPLCKVDPKGNVEFES